MPGNWRTTGFAIQDVKENHREHQLCILVQPVLCSGPRPLCSWEGVWASLLCLLPLLLLIMEKIAAAWKRGGTSYADPHKTFCDLMKKRQGETTFRAGPILSLSCVCVLHVHKCAGVCECVNVQTCVYVCVHEIKWGPINSISRQCSEGLWGQLWPQSMKKMIDLYSPRTQNYEKGTWNKKSWKVLLLSRFMRGRFIINQLIRPMTHAQGCSWNWLFGSYDHWR